MAIRIENFCGVFHVRHITSSQIERGFVNVPGITRAIAAVRLGSCIQDLTVDPLKVQRDSIILKIISERDRET
jgi:hypothetical protein